MTPGRLVFLVAIALGAICLITKVYWLALVALVILAIAFALDGFF